MDESALNVAKGRQKSRGPPELGWAAYPRQAKGGVWGWRAWKGLAGSVPRSARMNAPLTYARDGMGKNAKMVLSPVLLNRLRQAK